MRSKNYKHSLPRTYNRLKNPNVWGSVTKAVVFNPVDKMFVLTSIDGKDYYKALSRDRVVGVFNNAVEFNHLRSECEYVYNSFYPGKPFNYSRPL